LTWFARRRYSPDRVSPPADDVSVLGRYRRLTADQAVDLPLFAWLSAAFTTVGVLIAKSVAVGVAFPEQSVSGRALILCRVLPTDLLLLAAAFVLVLAARAGSVHRRTWRMLVVVALSLAVQLVLAAYFVNVEFLGSWGTVLTRDALRLAPHLASYILLVGVSNVGSILTLWAVLAIGTLLLTPVGCALLRPVLLRQDRWRVAAFVPAVVLAAAGLLTQQAAHDDYRERTLRRLNAATLLESQEESAADVPESRLSEAEAQHLRTLVGPADDGAARALAPLQGRRFNVVLWVWESVGARHIRSFHPLGTARTPNVDRLAQHGLRFMRAYAECPLSVSTAWAMLTGISPPARPFMFVDGAVPPHGPSLHGALADAGYRTAIFHSGYTKMWGLDRVFALGHLDALEDADALAARGNYAQSGIGVEDQALVDRSLEWIQSGPADRPFFLLAWNAETHRPYTWAGMPPELSKVSEADRYIMTIERADALLGELYDGLVRRGLAENTLIVVVGDHGEGVGRFGRAWDVAHGANVNEDAIQVPLLLAHPALAPATSATLSTHADLFWTLLDLIGVKAPPLADVPESMRGRSLMRERPPIPFFARALWWWPQAIRAGRYKLLADEPHGHVSLYDIESDPRESRDLKSTEPDIARLLGSALYEWHSQRFRVDGSFGYTMPSLARLVGVPMRSFDWKRNPPRPSEPQSPK
jgi:lipoteichoic acid synthase